MSKNRDYWRKRFEMLEDEQYKNSLEFSKNLEKQYNKAISNIERDINAWYTRFAGENGISFAEAKKILDKKELKEFKWTVEEYIEKGRENAVNSKWIRELENASARVHITRLESLKTQLQNEAENVTAKTVNGLEKHIANIYSDGYYKSIFEIQKGIGTAHNFALLDTKKIENYIRQPWSPDGKDFSKRVWGDYRSKLNDMLSNDLTQAIIRGDNPQKLVSKIAKDFDVSKYAARRLVMTESAAFASKSALDGYRQTGVEAFEISAYFDSKTCTECGNLDGQHYPISKFKIGDTAPPFHCSCRCTTVPYFNDIDDLVVRSARDEEGKTYEIKGNITYNQWKESFVNGKSNIKKDVAKIKKDSIIKLTENEQWALNSYISSGSYDINEKLRSGAKLLPDDIEFIKNLDSALDKMPNYRGHLVRSLYFTDEETINKFFDRFKGKFITFPEYISTSSKNIYNKNGQIQIYIENSSKGKDIRKYNLDEGEVLYQRGTEFEIINKYIKNNTIYILLKEK